MTKQQSQAQAPRQQHAETTQTAQTILDQAIASTRQPTAEISEIVRAFEQFDTAGATVEKSLLLAAAMTELRQRLDAIQPMVLSLMNTPLGFLTDRDPAKAKRGERVDPYDWPTVRDAVAEALLRGARLTGNEFNIIAGKCYLTKEYWERQFRELPGVSGVLESLGAVSIRGDRGAVNLVLHWRQDGRDASIQFVPFDGIDRRIGVRVNAGMGEDAVVGKALKRAYKAAYKYVSGRAVDEDADGPIALDPPGMTAAGEPQANQATANGAQKETGELATDRQLTAIHQIIATRKIDDERLRGICAEILGREDLSHPTQYEASNLLVRLQQETPR